LLASLAQIVMFSESRMTRTGGRLHEARYPLERPNAEPAAAIVHVDGVVLEGVSSADLRTEPFEPLIILLRPSISA
jgi:hypothetical protein